MVKNESKAGGPVGCCNYKSQIFLVKVLNDI